MEKIDKFIEGLSEQELEIFERELKEGYIGKYIERKREFFRIKNKVCPVCGNEVEDDCFVLIFGEPTLRKKAHFCGIDCLEYFVHSKLKLPAGKKKTGDVQQEEE